MLSIRLIRTALAFFVVSTVLGLYMGAAEDFRFIHVHVHLHLLGWVSLGLIGLIYHTQPRLQASRLAYAHYWLHTAGLLVFMGSFAWGSATGHKSVAFVAGGAITVGLGVLVLALNIALNLRQPADAVPVA